MHVLILGAAAGGGFPQWNCHCPNCKGLREGKIKAKGEHSRALLSVAMVKIGFSLMPPRFKGADK